MSTTSSFAEGRLLVVAFEGWNDAGEAASGVARALVENLEMETLAELDGEAYIDFQFNRPQAAHDDEGNSTLIWPRILLHGTTSVASPLPELDGTLTTTDGPSDGGLLVLLGAEPSRSWRSFAAEIVDLVDVHDITGVVFLGAMLADVPHTRPISIYTGSENPQVRLELTVERSAYEGPVGILSVLSQALEDAGIPTLSIWASVPHYVHNAPSPKASLAILDKLETITGVSLPREELVEEAAAWETGIDALAAEDEDMAGYIEQLEQARDTVDSPEASGEAIAQEFERYLRKRDGKSGDDPWRPPSV